MQLSDDYLEFFFAKKTSLKISSFSDIFGVIAMQKWQFSDLTTVKRYNGCPAVVWPVGAVYNL